MLKVDLLRFVLTESENQVLYLQTTRDFVTCHFMDAQSALRPDQLTGCSASLYAAARSKTSVDRKRLAATAMTECLLATSGLATTFPRTYYESDC